MLSLFSACRFLWYDGKCDCINKNLTVITLLKHRLFFEISYHIHCNLLISGLFFSGEK